MTQVYTNVQTASALMVTRNVTSTRVVTAAPLVLPLVTPKVVTSTSTVRPVPSPSPVVTSLPYPVLPEAVTEVPSSFLKVRVIESTTQKVIRTSSQPAFAEVVPSTSAWSDYDETTLSQEEVLYNTELPPHAEANNPEVKTEVSGQQQQQGTQSRIPRIIKPSWDNDLGVAESKKVEVEESPELSPEVLFSGQYHEVNPGQYHEVNPGQYHEVNPGQYHEVTPGQYTATSSTTSEKPLEVEVEVEDRQDNRRVYNVQSRVDEFIIGEYGTLGGGGQTLQGVRYTAVDDKSIDKKLIYDTLVKFFNFS